MSRFTRVLTVSPLKDGDTWVIRSDFGYEVGGQGSGEIINIPLGFTTDFASIPRPLWWLFPKWGKYGNAAVIHDFLYWEQHYPRRRADEIFLEGMVVLQVKPPVRRIIYLAVRWCGAYAWRKNQKARDRGEQRVIPLAQFDAPGSEIKSWFTKQEVWKNLVQVAREKSSELTAAVKQKLQRK